MSLLKKIFGDSNERFLKKLQPTVDKINSFESEVEKLSDEDLKNKTEEFKKRLAPKPEQVRFGAGNKETLDDLLPEAFACVREASKRTIGERHFDVQLLGGIALHQGKIAEMKTGEGKTLASTLPVYLNSLTRKGVHIVTVNDYLAKRDTNWMGAIYHKLGLSVGCIQHDQAFLYNPKTGPDKNEVPFGMENLQPVPRKEAYLADVTYGTNNEFGFDYLRDNMVQSLDQMVQRKLNYAIVDEVDSILIDEARTPLIISAPAEESTEMYYKFASLVRQLKENEDYNIDEKLRAATLTEKGIDKVEKILGVGNIYEEGGIQLVHHLEEALKAETIFKRDRDYVVKNGEVIIVDEFTGRLMLGRRYSEGLHQAIEAKEGVQIQKESQTLATITFQNYFRMYKKLAGMTGTAITSAEEFSKVYNLEVVIIPTNEPMIRTDSSDVIYKTTEGKFKAVASEIKRRNEKGQPVLVGTTSIEKNELLHSMLEREGVPHEILNAKNHEKEAKIISKAGQREAVTVATNMAGRGTDIKLGEGVVKLGGLHVIGTERHEARRIDNQLRGRSGRQGDPGSSQFYVSCEDDLMRIFGSERIKNLMERLGLPDDQPIENRMISRSLESAQAKVEGNNFDIRKHLLEYDDVMNKQREVIYNQRKDILKAWENEVKGKRIYDVASLKKRVLKILHDEIEQVVMNHTMGEYEDKWNIKEIYETMNTILPVTEKVLNRLNSFREDKSLNDVQARDKILEYFVSMVDQAYKEKEEQTGKTETGISLMRHIEKAVLLRTMDTLWIDHLDAVDYLREGIGLRGYGQRDPLVEYKREAYHLFQNLIASVQNQVAYSIFKVGVVAKKKSPFETARKMLSGAQKIESGSKKQELRGKKVGRNDPCPCGSGKKYKKCCGR